MSKVWSIGMGKMHKIIIRASTITGTLRKTLHIDILEEDIALAASLMPLMLMGGDDHIR